MIVGLMILVWLLSITVSISNGERLDWRINAMSTRSDNLVFLWEHLINQLSGFQKTL